MHEMSVAQALVDAACEAAAPIPDHRVSRVLVRIGALAGIVPEALRFSFEVASAETLCDGAELQIEFVPLVVRCPCCDATKVLAEQFILVCPDCGTSTPEILSGRELDLVHVELVEHDPAHC